MPSKDKVDTSRIITKPNRGTTAKTRIRMQVLLVRISTHSNKRASEAMLFLMPMQKVKRTIAAGGVRLSSGSKSKSQSAVLYKLVK